MQARGSRAGVGQNRQSLMEDLKHGDVVLFLGAGVSAGPASSWSSFLGCLVDSAVELGLAGKRTTRERKGIKTTLKRGAKAGWSPYAQAELVKRFLGRRYLGELRRALYGTKRGPRQAQPELLEQVARLCVHERVRAVVTYNFDDLLEIAKIGILAGSLVSGVVGYCVLRWSTAPAGNARG